MKHFFFKLIPPRPDFMTTMTDDERLLMQRHAGYLQGQMEKGLVAAFGPVADPAGAYGIAVVELPDDGDPTTLSSGDPVIQAEAGFRYQIHPMPRAVLRK